MSPQLDELTTQAMALPEADRIVLAQRLWESVDAMACAEDDEELFAEIARRDAEMDVGTVRTYMHEEVMEAARKAIEGR